MVFSSMTFLTLFLPLVLMGYYVCFLPVFEKRWPGAHRVRANLFLQTASLLFYSEKQYVQGIDGHLLFLNPMQGEKYHGSQNATVLDYLGINRLTAEQLSIGRIIWRARVKSDSGSPP